MFDNLREEANSKPFYDEEEAQFQPAVGSDSSGGGSRFLGMTPPQRFVIALMMMFAVCVIGALCLLVTERIAF